MGERQYRPGSDRDVITFTTLTPDGVETSRRELPRGSVMACPHCILVPEHYHANGECRCTDRDHAEMSAWGYVWDEDAGVWQ